MNPPKVKGIINFAGGIKKTDITCRWEQSLIQAFASYGKKSSIPTLWFYGENDSYWGAELPKKMHEAYVSAGGQARFVSYGVFPFDDAHRMINRSEGVQIWLPEVLNFLKQINLK